MQLLRPMAPSRPERSIPRMSRYFVVWPKPEAVNVSPSLIVRSPLNAIFDEGITWEDAEWQ